VIGAEIVCSDESCAVTLDVVVDSLADLELLACEDCSCTIQVLAVWDVVELRTAATVTALRRPSRRLAA
jgi:hypothetical protein